MPDVNLSSLESELYKANKHISKLVSYKHSFFRGIITGFGWSLGATILITILLWALAQLEALPFLGEIIGQINIFIKNSSQNR